jgi:hypothetical protein
MCAAVELQPLRIWVGGKGVYLRILSLGVSDIDHEQQDADCRFYTV